MGDDGDCSLTMPDEPSWVQINPAPCNIHFFGPNNRLAMTIRFDTDPVSIEVADDVSVEQAAKDVLDAAAQYINQALEAEVQRRLANVREGIEAINHVRREPLPGPLQKPVDLPFRKP
jgi:hypothetical protein